MWGRRTCCRPTRLYRIVRPLRHAMTILCRSLTCGAAELRLRELDNRPRPVVPGRPARASSLLQLLLGCRPEPIRVQMSTGSHNVWHAAEAPTSAGEWARPGAGRIREEPSGTALCIRLQARGLLAYKIMRSISEHGDSRERPPTPRVYRVVCHASSGSANGNAIIPCIGPSLLFTCCSHRWVCLRRRRSHVHEL